jgi:hypothetical protein
MAYRRVDSLAGLKNAEKLNCLKHYRRPVAA